MSASWITAVGPWHWLLIAIVLMILEAFSPAAFFMWLAIAAGTVGLVLVVVPELGWQVQLVLFGVLSVLSLVLGRRATSGAIPSRPIRPLSTGVDTSISGGSSP